MVKLMIPGEKDKVKTLMKPVKMLKLIMLLRMMTLLKRGGGHRFLKTVDSTTFWVLGLQIYNKLNK